MADNFQRVGAISNSHVGRDFESAAMEALAAQGISVQKNYAVEVGVGERKKQHSFDLGSDDPPVLVECKSHRWTSGSNVPSAKLTVWNEAMYYFYCSPEHFRKILFVLHDKRSGSGETLSRYYIRCYGHLIPEDVEIWEFDPDSSECIVVHSGASPKAKKKIDNSQSLNSKKRNAGHSKPSVTAEEIRTFVNRNVIEPARENSQSTITLTSGEVHKGMGLVNRFPAVCSAIGAQKFQDQYRVALSRRTGPKNGSTVTWVSGVLP